MTTPAQLPIEQFLEQLAARAPTPGGGSASALGGAIGVATAQMAAAFTLGNEKFKLVEGQVAAISGKLAELRQRFSELMQKDIEAYAAYASARAMPKTTAEEKRIRSAAIAAANETATAVPEEIVAAVREALQIVEGLSIVANPNLAGDIAVAAYFLEAAARGAAIQVISNCSAPDTEGGNAVRCAAVEQSVAQCQAARERIDAAVKKMMKL